MNNFIEQLQLLTGQKTPLPVPDHLPTYERLIFAHGGLDYSQLNEFLLALGYDRITKGFFNDFLCPQEKAIKIDERDEQTPFRIESLDGFKTSVNRFRKLAMLKYGNFKFAFKTLSKMSSKEIREDLQQYEPISDEVYKRRPVPLIEPSEIKREHTYLLGYIAGDRAKKLKERKKDGQHLSSEDETLIKLRDSTVKKGLKNYQKYLTDDYMDVYVATSMRRREDFYAVHDFIKGVFAHSAVKDLELRYFDPTQADPQDRLAKGLLEGLMVKRAKCTIYCAQESDTFGKDSELAATLAQGKPVIVYVPKIQDLAEYEQSLMVMLKECSEGKEREYVKEVLLQRHPRCVLENAELMGDQISIEELIKEVARRDQRLYDGRTKTLREIHPLSLQINLQDGVANGVLLVRSVEECALVLRGIILGDLEFDIETVKAEETGVESFILKERSTESVFRVVTGDILLTNTFWNFYLPRVPE